MKPLLYMVKGVRILRTSNAPCGDTAGKPAVLRPVLEIPNVTLSFNSVEFQKRAFELMRVISKYLSKNVQLIVVRPSSNIVSNFPSRSSIS